MAVTIKITGSDARKMVLKHQTYADFVTQHNGTLDNYFEFALLNDKSITDETIPGEMLFVTETNNRIVSSFEKSGVIVSSDKAFDDLKGGIGYMRIMSTFIVS